MTDWTRNDLFARREIVALSYELRDRGLSSRAFADAVLDAVVEHLNAHHPKPDGSFAVMLEDTHRAQRERDEALRKKGEMVDRAVRAERELDAAVARAEGDGRAAEREPTVPASQLRAFARLCVDGGDMTPAAARMLDRIIDGDGGADQ